MAQKINFNIKLWVRVNMRVFYLCFLAIFFGITIDSISQEFTEEPYQDRSSFGVLGGYGINFHSADFSQLEGVASCCPGYESGSGAGILGGLFYAQPIGDKLELLFRLTYQDLSGTLSRDEINIPMANPNGGFANGSFEHRIVSSLASAGIQALVSYRMTDEIRVSGGFRVGSMLTTYVDEHIEEIKSPNWGTFTDTRTRTRNSFEGELPAATGLEYALMGAISYDLPLNSNYTLFLVPELNISYGLSSFVENFSWNVATVGGAVGVRWAPRARVIPKPVLPPPPPPPPPPLPPPPPPPVLAKLDAKIDAVSLNEDGSESAISNIIVEEFVQTKVHPILNYVFFDENSGQLPPRYKKLTEEEKKNFSFKGFMSVSTMDVYHNVLNIIGRRMKFYPQATLSLTGCNSDEGAESQNLALSKQRVEAVKDYLVREWKIDDERIIIKSRNLPEIPSNTKEQDGIEENRRVEIVSNLTQIFEPVTIYDTLVVSNPPKIRFKPNVFADMGIKEWKVETSQGGKKLRVFSGKGEVPKFIDWDVEREEEQAFVPRLELPLDYKMIVIDNDGKSWVSNLQTLPVTQNTIQNKIFDMVDDQIIDKFSMIGFDFGKDDLNAQNAAIGDIIKRRIRRNSTTTITGHSDRLGAADFNQRLSQRRAESVAKYLNQDPKKAKGLGEQNLLYNNDLPEGRFYSRTVRIDLLTPFE